MHKTLYIFCLLLFGEPINVAATKPIGRELIYAKVIDCTTGKTIPYAELFNESTRTGAIADSSGLLGIYAQP